MFCRRSNVSSIWLNLIWFDFHYVGLCTPGRLGHFFIAQLQGMQWLLDLRSELSLRMLPCAVLCLFSRGVSVFSECLKRARSARCHQYLMDAHITLPCVFRHCCLIIYRCYVSFCANTLLILCASRMKLSIWPRPSPFIHSFRFMISNFPRSAFAYFSRVVILLALTLSLAFALVCFLHFLLSFFCCVDSRFCFNSSCHCTAIPTIQVSTARKSELYAG